MQHIPLTRFRPAFDYRRPPPFLRNSIMRDLRRTLEAMKTTVPRPTRFRTPYQLERLARNRRQRKARAIMRRNRH